MKQYKLFIAQWDGNELIYYLVKNGEIHDVMPDTVKNVQDYLKFIQYNERLSCGQVISLDGVFWKYSCKDCAVSSGRIKQWVMLDSDKLIFGIPK